MTENKNEEDFSEINSIIDRAIEVIEHHGEESKDSIENARLWVETAYSKNKISFDEYFDFKRRLINCEVKKLEKKYHVKCCISISELSDINSTLLG